MYDFQSIMHYGRKQSSKNGKNTLSPKNSSLPVMLTCPDGTPCQYGQREMLSALDAEDINHVYNCTHGKYIEYYIHLIMFAFALYFVLIEMLF